MAKGADGTLANKHPGSNPTGHKNITARLLVVLVEGLTVLFVLSNFSACQSPGA